LSCVNCLQIIIERAKNEKSLGLLDKSKFLVPEELTMSQLTTIIRYGMCVCGVLCMSLCSHDVCVCTYGLLAHVHVKERERERERERGREVKRGVSEGRR
jgi:microtubule-associated protein 1 light chain